MIERYILEYWKLNPATETIYRRDINVDFKKIRRRTITLKKILLGTHLRGLPCGLVALCVVMVKTYVGDIDPL